jgi:two-component system chemotaxis response regulator CheB
VSNGRPAYVVVVGTSAGGLTALQELVHHLPRSLGAAVLVVMHIPPQRVSALPEILGRAGLLPAVHAQDGEAVEAGVIYVAPPDRHLLIFDGRIRLGNGPLENHTRPAVDPLFRSAALSFGPRTVGVVLSGLLGDGTAGMFAIKRRGGLTAVQDPDDAAYRDMPESVLRSVEVDCRGTVPEIATFVAGAFDDDVLPLEEAPMDDQLRNERDVAAGVDVGRQTVSQEPPSVFSCPDCGGVLWQIEDGENPRFRCRVGHAYSDEALFLSQAEQVEDALWVAVRSLSENAELSARLAKRARDRGEESAALRFEQRRDSLLRSIDVIRGGMDVRASEPA